MKRSKVNLLPTALDVACLNDSETELQEWRFALCGTKIHFTRYQRSTRAHETAPWEISHLWKALDLAETSNIEKPRCPDWAREEALERFQNALEFTDE